MNIDKKNKDNLNLKKNTCKDSKKLEEKINENNKNNINLKENIDDNDVNNINFEKLLEENSLKEIDNLKKEIKEKEKIFENKILRLNAELDNVYKRNLLEIEKIYKYSLEKFFIELLPVIDNLERTKNEINNNIDINTLNEGIKITLKLFLQTIIKFGIKSIDSENVPFNPDIHQAISTIKNENINNNYVYKIVQKGYLLNNRIIRPAMVIVSVNDNNKK